MKIGVDWSEADWFQELLKGNEPWFYKPGVGSGPGKPKNAKGGASADLLTGAGSSNPVGGMLGGTKKSKAIELPSPAASLSGSTGSASRRRGSTVRDVTVVTTGATSSGVARDLQWEMRG